MAVLRGQVLADVGVSRWPHQVLGIDGKLDDGVMGSRGVHPQAAFKQGRYVVSVHSVGKQETGGIVAHRYPCCLRRCRSVDLVACLTDVVAFEITGFGRSPNDELPGIVYQALGPATIGDNIERCGLAARRIGGMADGELEGFSVTRA